MTDILFAAALSLGLFVIIKAAWGLLGPAITGFSRIGYHPQDEAETRANCYEMFPIPNLQFKNACFERGMDVQLRVRGNRLIKGKFMGANPKHNLVCILTPEAVVACEARGIEEMTEA